MKKFLVAAAAATTLVLMLGTSSAIARSGGGSSAGGGGNVKVEASPSLVFDNVLSINGSLPSWSGTYSLTNPIPGYYTWCSINMSFKGKPVNVPDGTPLYVTVFTSDVYTGLSYDPYTAPNMIVSSKVATERASLTIMNPVGVNCTRQIDGVVVSTADGTIVTIAHP
jgi:hypothetical protein